MVNGFRFEVNEIINQPKFDVRTDIQMLARIMRIILYIEEEEGNLAEYEIIATTRYLKKMRKDNPTEKKNHFTSTKTDFVS